MPFLVGAHHHVMADMDHIVIEVDVLHLQGGDLTAPERASGGEHDADPQLGVILGSGLSLIILHQYPYCTLLSYLEYTPTAQLSKYKIIQLRKKSIDILRRCVYIGFISYATE